MLKSLQKQLESISDAMNKSLANARNEHIIQLKIIDTILGPYLVASSNEKICLLQVISSGLLESSLRYVSNHYNSLLDTNYSAIINELNTQLIAYLERKLRSFSLPIFLTGTDFQKEVWHSLEKIPYGQTISYKEQAAAINRPKAIRAVANANSKNPVAIIIPCHRVIGSNGNLTGYAGGLNIKEKLLALEQSGIKC